MERMRRDALASPQEEIEANMIAEAKENADAEAELLLDYKSILEDIRPLKEAVDQFKGGLPQLERIEAVLERINAKDNNDNMKGVTLEKVREVSGGNFYVGLQPESKNRKPSGPYYKSDRSCPGRAVITLFP